MRSRSLPSFCQEYHCGLVHVAVALYGVVTADAVLSFVQSQSVDLPSFLQRRQVRISKSRAGLSWWASKRQSRGRQQAGFEDGHLSLFFLSPRPRSLVGHVNEYIR